MNSPDCARCNGPSHSRREFLRVGSLGLLGIGLSQYLQISKALADSGVNMVTAEGKAKACIFLLLEGGPSHLDTWDVKGNSSFKPIATNVPGIQISETLPKIARHMDKLAIIRSMHSLETNHPQGTYYALTGHRPNAAMKFPSFGSIISRETGGRNGMPPYVLVPTPWEPHYAYFRDGFNGNFAGADYNPMAVPDPSLPDFKVPNLSLPKDVSAEVIENRRGFLNIVDRMFREKEQSAEQGKMDAINQKALEMLLSDKVKQAFDLSKEPDKIKDAYGRDRVGQSLLMARRLVEAGCRFVTAAGYKHGEWDTHSDNNKILRENLVPTLDRTLSALLEDLQQRGMLESTVVLAMGEFGRTPDVNAAGGRDHYPKCWSLVVGGGGIKGGQVIGASDKHGAEPAECPTSIGDLYATIYKAFGIDYTKTYMSPIGRPIYIANNTEDKQGEPIKGLV